MLLSTLAGKPRPWRVIVGAGRTSQEGWFATSPPLLDLLKPATWDAFLAGEKVDAILAEHVWHMLTWNDAYFAARVCRHYLSDSGYLRIAVPDGFHPDLDYLNWVRPNGVGPSAPAHYTLYDYRKLTAQLEDAGFEVACLEYFDEQRQFHQGSWAPDDGLVRRSAQFDERNAGGPLKYSSLIIDARKRP
jgi:predicted SAM-dependent methyltransferase